MSSYDAAVLAEITGTESHVAAYDQAVDFAPNSSVVNQTPRPTRPSFPGGFLVLAPTISSDYPAQASSRASSIGSTAALPSTSAIDDSAPADAAQSVKKDRRSSSVSSTSGYRRRVLKLGPVHNGETVTSDYVEVDEE